MESLAIQPILALAALASVASTSAPSRANAPALVFDSLRNATVLVGGLVEGQTYLETWAWEGEWWRRIDAPGPRPRMSAGLAFDSRRGRIVLFGGGNLTGTWEWDGRTWNHVP
jgi:hypothetical protein